LTAPGARPNLWPQCLAGKTDEPENAVELIMDMSPYLKERIRNGERLVGVGACPMEVEKADLEKTLASDRFDFIMVDSQHTAFTEPILVRYCGIAQELGVPLIFRIMDPGQLYLIGKYLDLGASGIEIPQVTSKQVATDAVKKFYYPPLGIRSFGGSARVKLTDFRDRIGYIEKWNKYGMLWLQLESIEAVNNARSLAKPGVDCLSFGPSDLIIDMTYNPHSVLKTVDDCVRHAVRETEGTETVVCYRHGNPEDRQKFWDMGVRVLVEPPRV
jgi:2-keto-3-deoxy-L-rhamnonate aldolase RhmA